MDGGTVPWDEDTGGEFSLGHVSQRCPGDSWEMTNGCFQYMRLRRAWRYNFIVALISQSAALSTTAGLKKYPFIKRQINTIASHLNCS